ncbi:MAG: histidine kinase, partial [Acidobacteriota bacterium]|nr:histidine kinase [Acidobacteriota bacterium]
GEYLLHFQSNGNDWLKSPKFYAYDFINHRQAEPAAVNFPALADLLEAESFVSIPLFQHEEIIGRVYLTSNKNLFDDSDTEFVRQFFEQILPSIKNIELLDLLASEAAETQRHKISRDIHDSTIQPYIGLKLGLEALEIKSSAGQTIYDDIETLIKLADSSIADLRGFVRNLESGTVEQTGDVLINALRRQIEKFQQFYGVKVQLQAGNNFHLNDRLAAEIFQMVLEGLSNIRRHTAAKSAFVNLSREAENMIVEIANPTAGENTNGNFIPKSIKGRTESLGGELNVERRQNLTIVVVKIPL